MKRSSGSTSNRTSPSLSHAERTAGDRGGGNSRGRSATGKPEPPEMRSAAKLQTQCLWQTHGDPPGTARRQEHGPPGLGRKRRRPWQTRGDPPGTARRQEHGPPGLGRKRRRPWQTCGDPPGMGMLQEHGPPGDPPWRGNARGDPPMVSAASALVANTYGLSSGPIFQSRESIRGRPPPLTEATGPPGAMTLKPLSYWPPPGCGVVRRIATMARQARGDPPGTAALRRVADPPLSRVGPAPPGRASPERIGRAPLGRLRNHRRGPPGAMLKERTISDLNTYGHVSGPKISPEDSKLNGKSSTSQRESPPGPPARQTVRLTGHCPNRNVFQKLSMHQ